MITGDAPRTHGLRIIIPSTSSQCSGSTYAISVISQTITSAQEPLLYKGFRSSDRPAFHPVNSAETTADHQRDARREVLALLAKMLPSHGGLTLVRELCDRPTETVRQRIVATVSRTRLIRIRATASKTPRTREQGVDMTPRWGWIMAWARERAAVLEGVSEPTAKDFLGVYFDLVAERR